jgi:diaminopimelate decarboxylase
MQKAGFTREDGRLCCDGVTLEDAAARFGTPLYVYSASALLSAYDAYALAFAGVPYSICYALKANSSQALLRLLCAKGAGADIVSGMEMRAALRAGFPAERIVFSGVGKTDEELTDGVEAGIGGWNAEGEEEIARLSRVATSQRKRVSVALRVNPDIDARSHPYITTGLRDNKFGVDIKRAPDILAHARALPGVEIVGLSCHIGSQIMDLDPIEEAVRELARLSRWLLAEGFPLKLVDIGGGLGVGYDTEGAPSPADLAARVLPHLKELGLTVLLEPGRSLIAAAGMLVTRVLSVKENRGKAFVIVDAGMNDLLRPALYQAHHRVELVASRPGDSRRVDVVGPVCETGDFLARDRELPLPEPGDLIAVFDAGAYGFCMSSNYNLRPRPAEVLGRDGALRLIRSRETFEDLVRNEIED